MKTMFGLVLALFIASPVLAQHGHNHGGGAQHQSNQSHQEARRESRPREDHHDGHVWKHEDHQEWHRTDRHEKEWREYDRRHWDGHRFDRGYYGSHFGSEHRFHPGRSYYFDGCNHFRYNGFWFAYYEPWPWDVYEDYFIILDDDGYYYAYSPHHVGWRTRVVIIVD